MSHGPRRCLCCGEEESQGGCVRGFRCLCDRKPECTLCRKCPEHHHGNCTPELREQTQMIMDNALIAVAQLREKHKINLFEYGERTDDLPFGLRGKR